MKNIIAILTVLMTYCTASAMELDSIKTIKDKGTTFVLHKIDKGETFYSICKRYGAKPSDALKFNPSALDVIKTGETLKIPLAVEEVKVKDEVIEQNTESFEYIFHKVEQGETLYAISRRFRVSVEDLKKWNGLTTDVLAVDQNIKVGKKNKTITIEEVLDPDTIKYVEVIDEVKVDVEKIPDDVVVTATEVNPTAFENLPEGADVTESGFVKFISDEEIDQTRNYVLHPKAKVGTIIMITNPQNNKSVFARVLGPYNVADDENQGIIMLITKNTAKKIGLKGNDNLLVELNYTK